MRKTVLMGVSEGGLQEGVFLRGGEVDLNTDLATDNFLGCKFKNKDNCT